MFMQLSITKGCKHNAVAKGCKHNVVAGEGGGMGVISAWSPLGNFLEGQVHPDKRIFKDLWICAFYL